MHEGPSDAAMAHDRPTDDRLPHGGAFGADRNDHARAPIPRQLFYVIGESPCPYLSGRWERKLVTELSGPGADDVYSRLSRGGFRRSHRFAYRPACGGCNACVPVRIRAHDFRLRRGLGRIARHNADLALTWAPPVATGEQFDLFARYIRIRHGDGEMADMAADDYRILVEDTAIDSRLMELRLDGRLLACCIADRVDDGFSAVYSFFDPDENRRSLGTYSVIRLVEETRRLSLPFVYLGYWIAQSPKMAYKARFKPLEALGRDGWKPLDDSEYYQK
jgi:arginine-tRNA-protein transferase